MKRSYAKTWKILYMFCPRLYLFLRTHPNDWFCTFVDWYGVHFYPSTFVYSRISPKIQFLECFLSSVAPLCGPMLDTEGKCFWNLGLQIAGKCIFVRFFLKLWRFWAVLKKSCLERCIQLPSFIRVWKNLNQRVRKIGE